MELPKLKRMCVFQLNQISGDCSVLSSHQELQEVQIQGKSVSPRGLRQLLQINQLTNLHVQELACNEARPTHIHFNNEDMTDKFGTAQ